MTGNEILQIAFYLVVLLALAKPLGAYMARVYEGRPIVLGRALGWLERFIYRAAGVAPGAEMGWKTYALTMLLFNLAGLLAVYAFQRLRGARPVTRGAWGAVPPASPSPAGVSFGTNPTGRGRGGEPTMSFPPEIRALPAKTLVAAAGGWGAGVALLGGSARRSAE